MKKIVKWLLIALGALVLLVIALAMLLFDSARMRAPTCEPGALSSIETCKKGHALTTWMGSGWWYTLASGPLQSGVCALITDSPETIDIQTRRSATLFKADCSAAGFPNASLCYAIQSLSSNGNTRYLDILAIQNCESAQLFQGSKARMIKEKPAQEKDWGAPYPDIPTLEKYQHYE